MKKFAAILLVCVVAASAAFAGVDMKLALGGQSYGVINIDENNAKFKYEVGTELDMDFGRGHGMLVGIDLIEQDIALNVGYAYQTDISSSCDFILGAGATIVIKDSTELNFFLTADFDFNVSQSMFVRVGTGILLNMGELGENYGKRWSIQIPLPALAIGWQF